MTAEEMLALCEKVARTYQTNMEKYRDEALAIGKRQNSDLFQEHANAAEEIADNILSLKEIL
jgi:hypothetical protein